MVAKRVPLKPIFRVGNSQKSLAARTGEYGGHFYVQVLQRLRDAFRRKRRDKWQRDWFLHHDNAPSHTSLVVHQFLAEKSIPVIIQPPYSPDVASSDFWLFSTLKIDLKETRFATMQDIKSNATAELRKIPKEAFRRCFQQ
jgi:transposase